MIVAVLATFLGLSISVIFKIGLFYAGIKLFPLSMSLPFFHFLAYLYLSFNLNTTLWSQDGFDK